ncbi:MAG: hypothetical protein OXI41_15110 [Chloroflexota bacterium]|nr:hypothetical protein [Chloroflexota bacterium]MDE2894256.1 hypothetical protein [Chloroflexota bacterium]
MPLPDFDPSKVSNWLGWHTIISIVIGLAMPPVIALASGMFANPPELDYSVEAAKAAYPEVYQRHYAENAEIARTDFLVGSATDSAEGSAPWSDGVREGWRRGRIEAIDAMRDALATTDLPEDAFEYEILENIAQGRLDR